MTHSINRIFCYLVFCGIVNAPGLADAKDTTPRKKLPTAYIAIEGNSCEQAGLFENSKENKLFCMTATTTAEKTMTRYSFSTKEDCETKTGFVCRAYSKNGPNSYAQLLNHDRVTTGESNIFKPAPFGIAIPDTLTLNAKLATPYFRGRNGTWNLLDGRVINIPPRIDNLWERNFNHGRIRLS